MRTSRSSKKTVVITAGDPAGVGPEVTLKALASPMVRGLANFVLIADRCHIERTAAGLGMPCTVPVIDLENVPPRSFRHGVSRPAYGRAAVECLDEALTLLARGEARALVTAPINKASIIAAGYRGFQGHTDYLAGKTGSRNAVMMFVGDRLKATLVTRHIPLKKVPAALTAAKIRTVVKATHEGLRRFFGMRRPRIAVAGLNPHAGEGGLFGTEEARVIAPAVRALARSLRGVSGPLPPDVVFHDAIRGKYDAVVALYHDQGLIPFKMLHFADGVNMTLGLPFVRTSPDHGTAFDIAGRGVADPSSMIEAIRLACRVC